MTHYILQYVSQAYGQGSYAAGCYSEGETTSGVCSASTTAPGNGGLADTGIALIIIVTLACVLVFAALVVRIWRRKTIQS